MSQIFGNSKSIPGCFAKQKLSSGLKGAVFNMGGKTDGRTVVTRFSMTKEDDFVPVKCLGDQAYINLFGKKAVAEMDVTMTLFLIKGRQYTGIFQACKQTFDKVRLSGKKSECGLTIGSKVLMTGYATSITIGGDSTQLGLGDATVHVISVKDR